MKYDLIARLCSASRSHHGTTSSDYRTHLVRDWKVYPRIQCQCRRVGSDYLRFVKSQIRIGGIHKMHFNPSLVRTSYMILRGCVNPAVRRKHRTRCHGDILIFPVEIVCTSKLPVSLTGESAIVNPYVGGGIVVVIIKIVSRIKVKDAVL